MSEEEKDDDFHLYKILLLGDCAVGKSCLLLRYCDDSFQEAHLTTIGLDFRLKNIYLENNRKIKIQIWDTAGEDRFRAITRNYYKGANGILLIFDVTNKNSFEHVRDWIQTIREESSEAITIYLVGNKIDINDNRIISKEEGNKLADEFKMPYFETSAKKNLGVDDVFMSLIKEIDKLYKELHNEEIEDKNLNLSKKKKKRKKCC
jgi:small GTP-binding protein